MKWVNKFSGLRIATLFKKLQHRCFLVSFAKFSKVPFVEHHRVTTSDILALAHAKICNTKKRI